MKNSLLDKLIAIVQGLFIFTFVMCAVMAFTGDIKEIPSTLGMMSLIGLLFMFFFSLLYDKVPEEQQQLNSDYYISLVKLSENNPKKFQKDYKWLIGHGTRYIVLLITLIILSFEGIIAMGVSGIFGVLGAGLFAVLYTIIKSLYIESHPIEGYEISEKSSPEIIKTIEKARAKTNSPKLDKIIVIDGANCGVLKNSLGFGFKSKDTLAIGIFLLIFLTPEELESIYIHEFAHIYKKDTHFSKKINRAIIRWSNILENLKKRGFIANTLLKGFAENYIAKMEFYHQASSKFREILADKEAAEFSGKEIYARASMKMELIEYYLNKPSENIDFDFRNFDAAPTNAYDLMIDNFLYASMKNISDWKSQILKRISNKADTHPSYKERMAEIGVDNFDFEVSFEKSSLPELRKIIDDMNAKWHTSLTKNWDDFTADYRKSKDLIREFEFSDNDDKNMEAAMAFEELLNIDEALKIYEKIIAKNDQYAPALFRIGFIHMNRNDEKGIDFVKSAMELDNDFINAGLHIIQDFIDRNGLKDKKEELREWAVSQADIYKKKIDEAESLNLDDELVEAYISDEQRQKLKDDLEKFPNIKRAFIVTKKLKYSKNDLLIVAISSKPKFSKLLKNENQLENPGEVWEVLNTLNTPCFLLDLNIYGVFYNKLSHVKNSELIKR